MPTKRIGEARKAAPVKVTREKKTQPALEVAPIAKPKFFDDEPLVLIRLKRNVHLAGLEDFTRDKRLIQPPTTFKTLASVSVEDPRSINFGSKHDHVIPVFDMNALHEILLPRIKPRDVVKAPGMTDGFHQMLMETEYRRAIAEQERAETLRRLLQRYSAPPGDEMPSIEIAEDTTNFMAGTEFYSDGEYDRKKAVADEALGAKMKDRPQLFPTAPPVIVHPSKETAEVMRWL